MGWLRSVGSIKSWVSFAEYRLFYRALLQKRPIILSILRIEAHIRSVWNGWYTHIPLYKPLFEMTDVTQGNMPLTRAFIHACIQTSIYPYIHPSIPTHTQHTHTHKRTHLHTIQLSLPLPPLPRTFSSRFSHSTEFDKNRAPLSHLQKSPTKIGLFCKRDKNVSKISESRTPTAMRPPPPPHHLPPNTKLLLQLIFFALLESVAWNRPTTRGRELAAPCS